MNCYNHLSLMPIVCALLNDLIREREIHENEMRNSLLFLFLCHFSRHFLWISLFFTFQSTAVGGGRKRKDIDYDDDSLRLYERSLTYWWWLCMKIAICFGIEWRWTSQIMKNPIIKNLLNLKENHWSISNAYKFAEKYKRLLFYANPSYYLTLSCLIGVIKIH